MLERLRAALAAGDFTLVENSTSAILPRSRNVGAQPVEPVADDDEVVLENELLSARTDARGVLLDLASPRTRVPIAQANLVTGLGRSPSEMTFELLRNEPFLRVGLHVRWNRLWGRLRLENWFAFAAPRVRYGIDRRFAAIEDERTGCAIFATPGTTWEFRALRRGGAHLRCELLRARGEAQLAWAFAPFEPGISMGALEEVWDRFTRGARVRLFTSDDPAVVVTACKPAEDGDGVLVTVRECDGSARPLRLRCGARMREVTGGATIEGETIVSDIGPCAQREFRVRF